MNGGAFVPRFFAIGLTILIGCPPRASGQSEQVSAPESLDLNTISRIRDEGLHRSHVMDLASGLVDGVGARLTGSPEFDRAVEWSIAQLKSFGVADAHAEGWGEFGMAWTQLGTSLLLSEPAPATLVAQATPWSPGTDGEVGAPVVLVPEMREEKEFDRWKGKLSGKIILYGEAPNIDPDPKPYMTSLNRDGMETYARFPLGNVSNVSENVRFVRDANFSEKVARFFTDQGAVAILRTKGEAGTFQDDTGSSFGWHVYRKDRKQPLPSAVVSPDGYGRMARLAARGVAVKVRLNVMAKFGSDHAEGKNVIGEIVGTDPNLKDQVVMLGAHLDSWIAGTGATDDGAGVVIALEAIRILKRVDVRPRRTIRVGLWGGEEQGLMGSLGYVRANLATVEFEDGPGLDDVPTSLRWPKSVVPKPGFAKFDAYFNADGGGGRFRGINANGNLGAAAIFRRWIAPIEDLGFSAVSLRNAEGVDRVRFDQVGLPGFEFRQEPRDYDSRTHHTNLDTYERLSEPDLKQAATIMAVFVYNSAQSDAMIPRHAKGH